MQSIQEIPEEIKKGFFQLITKSEFTEENSEKIVNIIAKYPNILTEKEHVVNIVIQGKDLSKRYIWPVVHGYCKVQKTFGSIFYIFSESKINLIHKLNCQSILGLRWKDLKDPFLQPIEIAFLNGNLELAKILLKKFSDNDKNFNLCKSKVLLCIFNSISFKIKTDKNNLPPLTEYHLVKEFLSEILKKEPDFFDEAAEILFKYYLSDIKKNQEDISCLLIYLAIKPKLDFLFKKFFKNIKDVLDREVVEKDMEKTKKTLFSILNEDHSAFHLTPEGKRMKKVLSEVIKLHNIDVFNIINLEFYVNPEKKHIANAIKFLHELYTSTIVLPGYSYGHSYSRGGTCTLYSYIKENYSAGDRRRYDSEQRVFENYQPALDKIRKILEVYTLDPSSSEFKKIYTGNEKNLNEHYNEEHPNELWGPSTSSSEFKEIKKNKFDKCYFSGRYILEERRKFYLEVKTIFDKYIEEYNNKKPSTDMEQQNMTQESVNTLRRD